MHQMEQVFDSMGVPWQGAAPFDLRPYITAMLRLCEERHVDNHPIEHLRRAACVLEALRGPVDLAELRTGEENAAQYEQWLSSAFPEVFAEMRGKAAERARKHVLN
jgi:hypothetical protein